MKKFGALTLIGVTVLLIGLMIGLLAGRYWGHSGIKLSQYDRKSVDSTKSTDSNVAIGKIDINSASLAELMMLPGIGETYAQRIIDYRNEHGMFTSIYELESISGIGKKRIESIAQYITAGG